MPELPEVETVLRTLEGQIKGCVIDHVEVYLDKVIQNEAAGFKETLRGETFRGFARRGKYLLFTMDTCILSVHLRMEGKFFLKGENDPPVKHEHVVFFLKDGRQLRYHDTRQFGRMELLPIDTDLNHFHHLGPEPFSQDFDAAYFHQARKGRTLPLKTLLLDQSFVAGVGNIYADEILFACGLRPGRSCARITRRDEENIILETRRILSEAIQAGGTTIRTYTSSLGVTGLFQLQCMVHEQKVCRKCGGDIHMKRIGGRSSYYCPRCQK